MKMRLFVTLLTSAAMTAFASTSTIACATDGCETVRGRYRINAVLSAGQGCTERIESITDTEASTNASGCTVRTKRTAGTSSCKIEMSGTCSDGTYVDVMNCEDDGETCSGAIQVALEGGLSCIYDYSATRM